MLVGCGGRSGRRLAEAQDVAVWMILSQLSRQFGVKHYLARVAIRHRYAAWGEWFALSRRQVEQRIARLLIANPKGKLAVVRERPDRGVPSKIWKGGGESAACIHFDRS